MCTRSPSHSSRVPECSLTRPRSWHRVQVSRRIFFPAPLGNGPCFLTRYSTSTRVSSVLTFAPLSIIVLTSLVQPSLSSACVSIGFIHDLFTLFSPRRVLPRSKNDDRRENRYAEPQNC